MIDGAEGTVESTYPSLPSTTFQKTSYTLQHNTEYRVSVHARIQYTERLGMAGPYTPDPESSSKRYSDGFLVRVGSNAELSVSPGALQFQEGETEKPVELTIRATGAGGITITSITVEKSFANASPSSGPTESFNISISGGGSMTLSRTLSLDAFDRAKALGGSQSGSMTVSYRIQGHDAYGNQLEAMEELPVTVSAGLPADLQIGDVNVELPPSPYYVGDEIQNPRVTVQATGSGQVTGQILLDDESDWTEDSAFSVHIDGETSFDIEGELPTTDPGEHTVTVEITDPVETSASATYTVSDERPPFPPETLILVPDVAELSDLNGTANATSNESSGYVEFSFTGTAKMKLLSLQDTVIEDVTVNELIVRYDNDKPTKAKIRGGTVEKEAEEEETFVTTADGYLKVKKVRFQGQKSPATDHILADAKLAIPKLKDQEIMNIEGLIVKTEGIEAKSFSYSESDAKSFNAFGMDFRLHDVDGTSNALVVGEDEANDRYYFSFSGDIQMKSKKGTKEETKTLTTFKDITFFSDGQVDAVITFKNSFDLVPDKLELTKISLKDVDDTWKLKLKGKLKKLPSPLDKMNGTEFEISVDKEGNCSGGLVLLKELEDNKKGHKLGKTEGKADDSEWDLGIGTLDLTYLEFVFEYEDGVFNKDYSEVRLGVDFYLAMQDEGGGEPEDDQQRVSFGELNTNGDFEGGVRLNMEGEFDWHSPTNAEVLSNKQLVLPGFNLAMNSIAIQTEPEFGIALTGSIVMGMEGVSGGVEFENLVLTIDGTISNLSDAITGGQFEVADSLKVVVSEIDWSTSPTSLTFESNETSGEGNEQNLQKGTKSIMVENYLRLEGAEINVGDSENPTLSGGFQEFTFYDPVDGGRSFVLRQAELETSGMAIRADVEYTEDLLKLAGAMTMPGDTLEAVVVGKFGRQDGEFTMGVFVAVSGLNMAVAPGLFLDGIGGGFFVNPVQDDVDLVRTIAGFKRPELEGEITKKKPGGADNPGVFALMLLGDFYIGQEDMLHGRSLLTLTANYFTLDLEASYAAKTVEGVGYLAVGWDPGYAEGNIEFKLNYFEIYKGEGSLGFYVYGPDTWAVNGEMNTYMFTKSGPGSSGSFFIGPPGMMVEMSVKEGMDLKVVSGSITYEGMFWYWNQSASSNFGLYAAVTAKGEILKIASGKANLQAALISMPELVVYAVGSVKLEVLSVEVFKGSMWVEAGMNGFDGGQGTKSAYDQMIEDARNMAEEMESAKEELMDGLHDAQLQMLQLTPEQLEAAGLALVESDSDQLAAIQDLYQTGEIDRWPNGLPPAIEVVRSSVFSPEAQQMAVVRTQLVEQQQVISAANQQLENLQENVIENFAEYEDIILEDLPMVEDLGQTGSPFGGYKTKTVKIGGVTKTVKVGFDLDIEKAEQQVQDMYAIREDFAEYQEVFIEQSGTIDAKLRKLDRILYSDQYNLSELNEAYTNQYQQINAHLQDYIEHQIEQRDYAQSSLDAIMSGVGSLKGSNTYSNYIEGLNAQAFENISASEADTWISFRDNLKDQLLVAGGETPEGVENDLSEISDKEHFVQRGIDLWWRIPVHGFSALQENCDERLNNLDSVFGGSMRAFRQTWSHATTLVDRIYARKADLYALLHEMYDQLSRYGSGDIAVYDDGNAAGFGTGAGFRFADTAAEISAQAYILPGSEKAIGPTIGPLRPTVSPTETGPGSFDPSGTKGGGFEGAMSAAVQTLSQSSSIGFTGATDGPAGTFASGAFGGKTDSGVSVKSTLVDEDLLSILSECKWVSIRLYFSAKRREIRPYIENPVFRNYSGTVTSTNPYAATVQTSFEAEHPVEVVEYSWSLSPYNEEEEDASGENEFSPLSQFIIQSGDIAANTQLLSQQGGDKEEKSSGGGLFGGLFGGGAIQTEIVPIFYIPWFSLGSITSLEDTLLPGEFEPGAYALTVRARGAGGTSSIRQGRLQLDYAEEGSSYQVSLDTSDDTPPSVPVVNVASSFTPRADAVYASWSASDPESGIQRYEYAVVPHSEALSFDQGLDASLTVPGVQGLNPAGFSEQESSDEIYENIDWENAASLTEMNIRGLELEHGREYEVMVRSTNGVGKMSAGRSEPFMVDLTPPEAAEILSFSQTTVDGYPNSITIHVRAPEDPESGITDCQISLGSTAGEDDIYSWEPISFGVASREITFHVVNVPVSDGQEVYLTIRGVNNAGIASDATASEVIAYSDSTPPEAPVVSMLPEGYTSETGYLQIGWGPAADEESGIVNYEYAIGSSPADQDVQGWTSVPLQEEPYIVGSEKGRTGKAPVDTTERSSRIKGASGREMLYEQLISEGELRSAYVVEPEGLQLEHNGTYYVFVRVTNGAGLRSESYDGLLQVDTSPPKVLASEVVSSSNREKNLTLEVTVADSESGIEAYRIGPEWVEMPGGGNTELISITLEPPYLPTLTIFVMNGAGLIKPVNLEVTR